MNARMKYILVLVFLVPFTSSFSLHYDPRTKTYNDLLISISPDLEGCKMMKIYKISQMSVFRDSKQGNNSQPEGLD